MSRDGLDVVLVEDDRHALDVTRQALRRHHLVNEVHVAADAATVLALLRRGERPYLVLVDLDLPDGAGLQLIRTVRDDPGLRVIPLIVLTASRQEPAVQDCVRLGASTFVVKPLDFVQFVTAVRELDLRWRLLPPG